MAKKDMSALAVEPGTMVDVENHVSWAGENFSHVPGQKIQLPIEIAEARQEAGLCTIL